jgi:hypothetical protein
VLQYTEKGLDLVRVISVNCFSDSKFIERNLLSSLTSIAKAYEPELIAFRAMGDEHLTQNVVLEQLGILTYPEIFEFCGNVGLIFPNHIVNSEAFIKGFCLQSENLYHLTGVDISHIKTIYFVENKTNFRHLVLCKKPDDTLVVYHGGFYSPSRRKWFRMLSDGLAPGAITFFWGDIDLGGFLMFTRLKRDLFPDLLPWRMASEDFTKYQNRGVRRSSDYIKLLSGKLDEGLFDPCFYPVARLILESGTTVEQEIML